MMKKFGKRLVSVLLTAMMLVGLVPTSALAAHADLTGKPGSLGDSVLYINPEKNEENLTLKSSKDFTYKGVSAYNSKTDEYPYIIPIGYNQESTTVYSKCSITMNSGVAIQLSSGFLDIPKVRFQIFLAVNENLTMNQQSLLFNSTFLMPDVDALKKLDSNFKVEKDESYDKSVGNATDFRWKITGDMSALKIANQNSTSEKGTPTTNGANTFDFGTYLSTNQYLTDAQLVNKLSDEMNTEWKDYGTGSKTGESSENSLHMNIYAIPVKMNLSAINEKNNTNYAEDSQDASQIYKEMSTAAWTAPMTLTSTDDAQEGIAFTVNLKDPVGNDNDPTCKDNIIDRFIPTESDGRDYRGVFRYQWHSKVDKMPATGMIAGNIYKWDNDMIGESKLHAGSNSVITTAEIFLQFAYATPGAITVTKTISGLENTEADKALLPTDLTVTITDQNGNPARYLNGEEVTATLAPTDPAEGDKANVWTWDAEQQVWKVSTTVEGLRPSDSTYGWDYQYEVSDGKETGISGYTLVKEGTKDNSGFTYTAEDGNNNALTNGELVLENQYVLGRDATTGKITFKENTENAEGQKVNVTIASAYTKDKTPTTDQEKVYFYLNLGDKDSAATVDEENASRVWTGSAKKWFYVGTGTGTGSVTSVSPSDDQKTGVVVQQNPAANDTQYGYSVPESTAAVYPTIKKDNTTYTYGAGSSDNYYTVTWSELVCDNGANYGDSHDPVVATGTKTWHIKGTITYTKSETPVNQVTLTYNANGGSGTMDSKTVNAGNSVTLTENAFTRTGYTFTGWNTAADGSGTTYTDKQTIAALNSNLTLYAQWKNNGEQYTDTSVSKTATNLDENYISNVTLGIPAQGYKKNVDVVFVVDATSLWSVESDRIALENQIDGMARELLEKNNINVNVSVVGFGHEVRTYLELTRIDDDYEAKIVEKLNAALYSDENIAWVAGNGGTNIQKGILAGKAILDSSSTGTDENNRYLVLMTDGGGFWYNDANGSTVCTVHNGDLKQSMGNMDANTDVGGSTRIYDSAYMKLKKDGGTFADFIAEKGIEIEKSAKNSFTKESASTATDAQSYTTAQVQNFESYPYINMERGTYYAAKALQSVADAGYQTITIGYTYKHSDLASLGAVSKGFLEWTDTVGTYYDGNEGTATAFEGIVNELGQFVAAGSKVIDVIGSGSDYNFDFVNELDKITIKVNDQSLTGTKVETAGDLATGETRYQFGDVDDADQFVLHYYADGAMVDGRDYPECFVLDINVPVTVDDPVSVNYSVKLTNPQSTAGTYGQFDADGSENYSSLKTNNSATLYPVNSEGKALDEVVFPEPTVSYTVERDTPIVTTKYTVTYHPNGGTGTTKDSNSYSEGATVTVLPNGYTRDGYTFTGWRADDGTIYSPNSTFTMPRRNVDIYAIWEKNGSSGGGDDDDDGYQHGEGPNGKTDVELDKERHEAYVYGYPDRTVQPEGNITREEVATIFFRLMTDASRAKYITDYNPFPDVENDRWSHWSITTLNNAGIMTGRTGGTFDPGAPITRAELAVVASQFSDAVDDGNDRFSDIAGHWAKTYINRAASEGWVAGYPDGTYGPDRYITRAEVMALINEVLERMPDKDHMLSDMIQWPDNASTSAWYYEDVQEATNSHDYNWITNSNNKKTAEDWVKMTQMRPYDDLVNTALGR